MLSSDSYRFMAFTPGTGGNFISAILHQVVTNESYENAKHPNNSNEYMYVTHSCANLRNYDISKAGNNWLDKNKVGFYVGDICNDMQAREKNITTFFTDSEFKNYHNKSYDYYWVISHIIQPGLNLVLQETDKYIYEKNILLLYKRALRGVTFMPDGTVQPSYTLENLNESKHFKDICKNIIYSKEHDNETLIDGQLSFLDKRSYKIVRNINWSNILTENYKKDEWYFIFNFFGVQDFMNSGIEYNVFCAIDNYIEENNKIINSDTGKGIRELLEKHT